MSHLPSINRRLALALAASALVLLSSLVLLGAGTAGVRSAAKDTTLTGMAIWPEGVSGPQTYVITGTFNGKLGYGTYYGRLTVTLGTVVPCSFASPCEPATTQILFSTNKGILRVRSDPTVRPLSDPAGVVGETGTSTIGVSHFQFDLVAMGGTGKYAHASGQLSLTYESDWSHYFDGSSFVFVSTIEDSGTLTGKVTT